MFYYFFRDVPATQDQHVIFNAPNHECFVEMLKEKFPNEPEPVTIDIGEDIRAVTKSVRAKLHAPLERFLNQRNVLVVTYDSSQDRVPQSHDSV